MTQIMVILVTLVSAVMTGILFPLIRSKVSAAQWELIKEFASEVSGEGDFLCQNILIIGLFFWINDKFFFQRISFFQKSFLKFLILCF